MIRLIKKILSFSLRISKTLLGLFSRGRIFYEEYFTYKNKNTMNKNNKEVWEKLSKAYSYHFIDPPDLDYLKKILDKISLRRGKILEYGCSSGMNLNYLSKNLKEYKFYGIDISEKAINIGKLWYPHLNLIAGTLFNPSQEILSFLGNKFDIIFTRAVLQHIALDELKFILLNLKKLMKPNASFIISECFKLDIPFGRIQGHRVYNTFNHDWIELLPICGLKIKEHDNNYIIITNSN